MQMQIVNLMKPESTGLEKKEKTVCRSSFGLIWQVVRGWDASIMRIAKKEAMEFWDQYK